MLRTNACTAALVAAVVLLAGGCDPAEDFENEGSEAAPVVLTLGVTHSGTIGASGTSYYTFTTAAAGDYTIALTALDSDLDWVLYDDAGFSGYVEDGEDHFDNSDEIKTVSLSEATPYYLMVDEWDDRKGGFRLLVSPP